MTGATSSSTSETNTYLRPRRFWPLGVYGLFSIWLFAVSLCLRLGIMGPSNISLEPFAWASLAAPLALVAMSRMQMTKRIRFFLALLALKVAFNLASELLSALTNPAGFPQLHLYEFARLSIRDLRDFAVVIAVAHALSSATMTYVTSQSLPNPQALQARIADWLYFLTIVGLAFLPQWDEAILTLNAKKEFVFSVRPRGIGQGQMFLAVIQLAPKIGAAITGLFWLTLLRDRGLEALMLVLILAQSLICATFAYFDLSTTPFSIFFAVFAIAAVISTPFWILLRIAGYHSVCSLRSILSTSAANSESVAPINP